MTSQSVALFHGCIVNQDEISWATLIAKYGRRIRNILVLEMKRAGVFAEGSFDEEDLMQELASRMLKLEHRGFADWHEGQIWSYLRRMARSVVIDHQRCRGAAKRPCEIHRTDCRVAGGVDTLPSAGPSPEDSLLAREGLRILFETAREILGDESPEIELEIVRLVLIEGLTSIEAAHQLSYARSPSQIDWLFHRLRRGFAQRGLTLPPRHGSSPSRLHVATCGRSVRPVS